MLQRTEPPPETDTSIIKSTKSVGGDALTKSGIPIHNTSTCGLLL